MGTRRTPRFDEKVTRVLRELREAVKLSQKNASDFFDLDRNSVANWEMGYTSPHKSQRSSFIVYLLDKLDLRNDHNRFKKVWNDVVVEMWEWDPLTQEEYEKYHVGPSIVVTHSYTSVFSTPPPLMYELVGRGHLLRELRQAMFTHNHVALYGIPGVGKTAIAVALAHDLQVRRHFADGILWARLGKNADPLTELIKWGALLEIAPRQIRNPADSLAWSEAIQNALSSRQMLLVVDDAWNSHDALFFKVGGPLCAHLLTTRSPEVAVHFASTNIVQITELEESDSLILLKGLASSALKDEREIGQELVRLVGGLPLALSLLGHYLHIFALTHAQGAIHSIVDELRHAQVRLQISQPVAPLEKHPSLPNLAPISLSVIIAITCDALDELTQQAFYALSAFPAKPNTFSDEAACQIASTTRIQIDHLVASGLLEKDATNRFMLHQTIADFANVHLAQKDSIDERMVSYFSNYINNHSTSYQELEQEMTNWHSAFVKAQTCGMHTQMIQYATELYSFFSNRGHYSIGLNLFDQAIVAAVAADDKASQAKLLIHKGRILADSGNYGDADNAFQLGLELAEMLQDMEQTSYFYQHLGSLAVNRGTYDEALSYFEKGLELIQSTDLLSRKAALRTNKAIVLANQGNLIHAETEFNDALDLGRKAHDQELVTRILLNLGVVADMRGDSTQSAILYQESLRIAQELGLKETMSILLMNLAANAFDHGDLQSVEHYSQSGLDLARFLGNPQRIIGNLRNLGQVAIVHSYYKVADQYLQEALILAKRIGHQERIGEVLTDLGTLATRTQQFEIAHDHLSKAQAISTELQNPYLLCMIDSELGQLHLLAGDDVSARSAFEALVETATSKDFKVYIAKGLFGLAQVAQHENNLNEAREKAKESHSIYATIQHADALEVQAWLDSLPAST